MTDKPKTVWTKNEQWAEEIDLIKNLLNETELVETVKWGGPTYVLGKRNVLGIGGFSNHFAVWFWNGVFLKDEAGKLVNANEGVTRGLRQWRFESIADIRDNLDLLRKYVAEAIANEKAGLAIKPEKKETVVPEKLATALASDSELRNRFEALSPYKQREYCEHIATAKQEKTQVARLEKIIPMIRAGIGFNDKYR